MDLCNAFDRRNREYGDDAMLRKLLVENVNVEVTRKSPVKYFMVWKLLYKVASSRFFAVDERRSDQRERRERDDSQLFF